MPDMTDTLCQLHRPRLLMRAARFGVTEYCRARDLRRLLRFSVAPTPEAALRALVPVEAELERDRVRGGANYSVALHIDVLIAMKGEFRLILARAAQPPTAT